eukprot:sb/3476084/
MLCVTSQGLSGVMIGCSPLTPLPPGGVMIGCSPGFLNVPKIKGTHNAMRSGIIAADTTFEGITSGSLTMDKGETLTSYRDMMKESEVYKELYACRNVRPSFCTRLGMWGGKFDLGMWIVS